MILFPSENITIYTELPAEEVQQRLKCLLAPERFKLTDTSGFPSDLTYEGEIKSTNFIIKRITGFRNSFIPIIIGSIKKENDRTAIHVKMKLHAAIFVIQIGWYIINGITLIVALYLSVKNNEVNSAAIMSFIMIAFAYAISWVGFKLESTQAKDELLKIFKGHIEEKKGKQIY